jgi:hypothetical protein
MLTTTPTLSIFSTDVLVLIFALLTANQLRPSSFILHTSSLPKMTPNASARELSSTTSSTTSLSSART